MILFSRGLLHVGVLWCTYSMYVHRACGLLLYVKPYSVTLLCVLSFSLGQKK